jgi:hypothetical protein
VQKRAASQLNIVGVRAQEEDSFTVKVHRLGYLSSTA